MKKKISCPIHDQQDETFVCQHIPQSLLTGERVGFFWSASDEQPRPEAWCSACEERRQANNGDWAQDCNTFLKVKILCRSCYDLVKTFNLGEGPLDKLFH